MYEYIEELTHMCNSCHVTKGGVILVFYALQNIVSVAISMMLLKHLAIIKIYTPSPWSGF